VKAEEEQKLAEEKIATIKARKDECSAAIDNLSKAALNEIVSYKYPTAIYIACLKILLTLFKIQPEGNNKKYSEWEIVFYTAKKHFGNAKSLLQLLFNLDKDNITGE
jgi:hypothetical protein